MIKAKEKTAQKIKKVVAEVSDKDKKVKSHTKSQLSALSEKFISHIFEQ